MRWACIHMKSAWRTFRQLSSRPIIAGGLASRDPSYLASAQTAVGALTVDAVGVHPYEERVANFPTAVEPADHRRRAGEPRSELSRQRANGGGRTDGRCGGRASI